MFSKCRYHSILTVEYKRQLSFSPFPYSILTQTNQNASERNDPSRESRTHFTYSTHGRESMEIAELTVHSFCTDALKVSAKMGFLHYGKQVHSVIVKFGLYDVLSLRNQVLNVYVKCNEFWDACKVLDEMSVRNVVTWNTVISGVVDSKLSNVYLGFYCFRRMLLEMVKPDFITFNGLLRACVEVCDVEIGRQLHCLMVKLGFDFNCFVSSALVDLYAKCGLVEKAKRVFSNVLCKDLVLWNVMVFCYGLNHFANDAFGLFNLMRVEGVGGDCFTFTSLLSSCCCFECCEMGKQIHGLIIQRSLDSDVLVASALVNMYAKNEMMYDARKAFDLMVIKNAISWTTMIVGYGHVGDGKQAMKLLQKMCREHFNPDELTLASVLSSCGNVSAFGEVVQVHAYAVKFGFQAFLSIANALINAYAKCGSIAGASQCFSSVSSPDLVTWTSILCAYAYHGLANGATEVFDDMLSHGIKPDRIAFLGILSACGHGGLVTKGLLYFNMMVTEYQIMPDPKHYTCVVDLLGRAGLLNEAFSVLTSMPNEPGSDILGAFIGSCNVHGYVELATWAAEKLCILEPNKPVNYTVMANAYASKERWLDVVRVHKMMKNRCNQKVQGSSLMDVSCAFHTICK